MVSYDEYWNGTTTTSSTTSSPSTYMGVPVNTTTTFTGTFAPSYIDLERMYPRFVNMAYVTQARVRREDEPIDSDDNALNAYYQEIMRQQVRMTEEWLKVNTENEQKVTSWKKRLEEKQ